MIESNRINKLIDIGLQAVDSRKPTSGCDWMRTPEFEMTSEERIESRFDNDLPVLQHLEQALKLAESEVTGHLAHGFRQVMSEIRWSQNPGYTPDNMDQAFIDGYAYAGLAGPDCPVRCEVPRLGFLLMGPNVHYPNHLHEPREFYLVLTSGAQWKLDDGSWFDVAAGELILHDAWQMHAMRTFDSPLLTFAGWLERGDRRSIRL